jgi:mannosyltransferase
MVLTQDETATLSAVSRSLPALVRLCAHGDGVLLGYYLLLRLWVAVFGTSPASLRTPSAVFAAAAAAVVSLLVTRLSGWAGGLVAGLVVALCPAVTTHAREARPYTLTLLLAAACTLLLVRALDAPPGGRPPGGQRARWGAWAVSLVALGTAQLTAVTLLAAHALVVVARAGRRLRPPLVAAGSALVLLLPVAFVGWRQRGDVSWIPETTARAVWTLPGGVLGSVALAYLAIGLAVLAVARRRLDDAVVAGPAIAVVPAVVLVAVSVWLPLVRPRYLLFTLVGWALLAGAAVGGRRSLAAVVVVLLVASVVPSQAAIWRPTRPGQVDTRAMAGVLGEQARPGDAIVVPTDRGRRVRVALAAYTGARPRDVLAVRSAAAAGSLDARECRPATCLGTPPRLWVACVGACRTPLESLRPETAAAIRAGGWVACREWPVTGGALASYARGVPC